jgi:hypothetical protein
VFRYILLTTNQPPSRSKQGLPLALSGEFYGLVQQLYVEMNPGV